MGYRNDHEAALMRVDALESEVARLRDQAAKKPVVSKPKRRTPWGAIVLSGGGIVAALAIGMMFRGTVQAAPPSAPLEQEPIVDKAEITTGLFGKCISEIAPIHQTLDEVATDPRSGTHESIAWLPKTAARCRAEIATASTSQHITGETRALMQRWGAAEDELGSRLSMITVYYGSDPYRLDNYSTSAQLWREFHRARMERDLALVGIKKMLAEDSTALDIPPAW
jgi:hypothetical protein